MRLRRLRLIKPQRLAFYAGLRHRLVRRAKIPGTLHGAEGYTSEMKIAAALAAHRRLLALCAASLLFHLGVMGWIAARSEIRVGARGVAPLVLRLADPGLPPRAPATGATPSVGQVPAIRPLRPSPVPVAATVALADPPAAPAAVQPAAPPAAADADASASAETLVQMPGRYRVRMPPSARLSYALYRNAAGAPAAPAGSARIDWQVDGNRYRLHMDGVLGQLSSQGADGDAGIAPELASEQGPDGTQATTRFDEQAGRIVFSAGAASHALHDGSQDRASLLMQLAGIGLADPDQMQGVIEVFVGGAADAGVVKFEVTGQQEVASTLGTLTAWHMVELARPGAARLEVWLAPQHGWLPVQLRSTAPDGTVSMQVLTQMETGAAGRR